MSCDHKKIVWKYFLDKKLKKESQDRKCSSYFWKLEIAYDHEKYVWNFFKTDSVPRIVNKVPRLNFLILFLESTIASDYKKCVKFFSWPDRSKA